MPSWRVCQPSVGSWIGGGCNSQHREDSKRWLNRHDPMEWVADDETARILTTPGFGFPLVACGLWQQGQANAHL